MLHCYRTITGGNNLTDVLGFYQTYRALVRANIAQLASRDVEIEEADRAAHEATAMRAYDLARSYALRRGRPSLVIMAGYSGSGKTAIAYELARRLPAVVLSSDDVRRHLARSGCWNTQDGSLYAPAGRAAVYDVMRRMAARYLEGSSHVILDATFLSPGERVAAAELARHCGAEFWIVECATDDMLVRTRLASRFPGAQASDADLAIYEKQQRTSEPISMPENAANTPGAHIVVDTANGVSACARNILDRFVMVGAQPATV
jgi:predicted kinase